MITNTFHNLKPEKKERVLKAIRKEIINNGIVNAKVTSISHEACIPRSAFYRYFETIEDAFEALIQNMGDKKRQKIINTLLDNNNEIYKVARELLNDIFNNPDEYLLIRNIKLVDFKILSEKLKKESKPYFNNDNEKFIAFKLLTNLIKSSAISHYENGIPKEELITEFESFIQLLKKIKFKEYN